MSVATPGTGRRVGITPKPELRRTAQGYGAPRPRTTRPYAARSGWTVGRRRTLGRRDGAAIELAGVAKTFGAVEALAPDRPHGRRRRGRHRARPERQRQDDAAAHRRRARRADRRARSRSTAPARTTPARPSGSASSRSRRPCCRGARSGPTPACCSTSTGARTRPRAATPPSCSPRSGSPTSPTPTRTSCRAGMQQRVALVRAIALGAPLLLMDEPFAALDEITRADMRHLLARLCEQLATTVLFVTHSIAESVYLSDRVVVLSARPGRVVGIEAIDLPRPAPPRARGRPGVLRRRDPPAGAAPRGGAAGERHARAIARSPARRRRSSCSALAVGAARPAVRRRAVHPPGAVDDRRRDRRAARASTSRRRSSRPGTPSPASPSRSSSPSSRRRAGVVAVPRAGRPAGADRVLVAPWVAYFTSIVIWLGRGDPPVIFLVAFVTMPAFVFATVAGLRSADPAARELLASVDASRLRGAVAAAPAVGPARRSSPRPASTSAWRSPPRTTARAATCPTPGSARPAAGRTGRTPTALWATIVRRCALGAVLLGLLTVLERVALRWHVSQRSRARRRGVSDVTRGMALGSCTSRRIGYCRRTIADRRGHRPRARSPVPARPLRRPCGGRRRCRRRMRPSHRPSPTPCDRARRRAATTTATTAGAPTSDAGRRRRVAAGEPFPDDRCAANEAAGTITYLSGFDFAATASIVDVVVAEEAGYYDELCLDVELHAELLDRQLPARRRRRGPVRLGRLVQRGRRLRHGQRRRPRRRRRRRPHRDRRPDRQARAGRHARGARAARRSASRAAPAERGGDARRRRARRGRRLRDGAARRLRPARPLRARRHRRLPRLQEQRAGAARAGRRCRSTCSTRPSTTSRVRSACSSRRASSSTSTRPRRRTSCGRRCAASPTPSPTRRRRPQTAIDLVEASGNPNFLSPEGETFRWTTDAALLAGADARRAGYGVPDADRAAGRGRRLRRGRPVRRRPAPRRRRARRRRPHRRRLRRRTAASSGPADVGRGVGTASGSTETGALGIIAAVIDTSAPPGTR